MTAESIIRYISSTIKVRDGISAMTSSMGYSYAAGHSLVQGVALVSGFQVAERADRMMLESKNKKISQL